MDGKGLRALQASGRPRKQGHRAPGKSRGLPRAHAGEGTRPEPLERVLGPGTPVAWLQAAFYQLGSRGRPRTEQNLAKLCNVVALARTPSLPANWPQRILKGTEFCVFPQEMGGEQGKHRQNDWCQACLRPLQGAPQHTGRREAWSFPADADSVDSRWASGHRSTGPGCSFPPRERLPALGWARQRA